MSTSAEGSELKTEAVQVKAKPKPKSMSLAMQYYLDKKRKHDAFIAAERSEFELGKKHLANMMGMEASEMTQEDIDKAIEYLFPAGLQEKMANPLMKPPEEIFPRQKEAEFDIDGRPFHSFFYTRFPNYTQVCNSSNHDVLKILY